MGRLGRQGFRRGGLIEDEDLATASWCLEEVFARLETCMPSQTATDLLYALGQISLTFRVLIFSYGDERLFYVDKINITTFTHMQQHT